MNRTAGGGTDDAVPTVATQLGSDWVTGPDGLPYRRGARLILLDDRDRVLMVQGHDMDQPTRRWWFTTGGGIAPEERPADAAVRELREETGLELDPESLVGPVATRTAVFDFARQTVRQDELFFLGRMSSPPPVSVTGWTDVERGFMDDIRWWPLEELAEVTEEVFPAGLIELVRTLLGGWDGVVRALPDQSW